MRRVLLDSLALGLLLVFGSTLVSGDRSEAAEHLAAGGSGLDAKVFIQSNASFVATGTVSASTISNTVTGTGTAFLTELQIGDRLQIGPDSRPVTSIASNVSLTVSSAFPVDSSGVPMTVFPAILRLDNSAGASQVLVTDLGNMQLGAVFSATPRLLVYQANKFSGTSTVASINQGNVVVATSGTQGVDVGGLVSLGGIRGTVGTGLFAGVRGAKENGTNDDVRGYLGLYTTDVGNTFAERARIGSTGNLGVGTTAPGQKIEVNGGVRLNTATVKPACDATVRGTFWVTQQVPGVEDSVEVCVKNAADAYLWRTVF
jgi:hypothetical protein